jgi:hypothetical protein
MPSTSSDAWIVWIIIVLFLVTSIGIIIWFAIDSSQGDPPEHLTFEKLTGSK